MYRRIHSSLIFFDRLTFGSLTIFALFPSDDEVIRRERPSRRMASPSDETNKVSFAKIVKEPYFLTTNEFVGTLSQTIENLLILTKKTQYIT